MPGTFSQLYIQAVFAVKGRENLILKSWKDDLHKYIAGTILRAKATPILPYSFLPARRYKSNSCLHKYYSHG
jgi:hypothetical protein